MCAQCDSFLLVVNVFHQRIVDELTVGQLGSNLQCKIIGVNSMAQDPSANYLYLQILCPRSQKTQLTQDMYIFEETISYFTQQYAKSL